MISNGDNKAGKIRVLSHLRVIITMSLVFVTITCIDTMWNRQELHFATDFAPRLIFEIGIGVVFVLVASLLRVCIG